MSTCTSSSLCCLSVYLDGRRVWFESILRLSLFFDGCCAREKRSCGVHSSSLSCCPRADSFVFVHCRHQQPRSGCRDEPGTQTEKTRRIRRCMCARSLISIAMKARGHSDESHKCGSASSPARTARLSLLRRRKQVVSPSRYALRIRQGWRASQRWRFVDIGRGS
jgi:hypothetical protein